MNWTEKNPMTVNSGIMKAINLENNLVFWYN